MSSLLNDPLTDTGTSQQVRIPSDFGADAGATMTPFNRRFPYLKRRAIIPAKAHLGTGDKKKEVDPDCKVDLNNVQGDVYYMFPKACHAFCALCRYIAYLGAEFREIYVLHHKRQSQIQRGT